MKKRYRRYREMKTKGKKKRERDKGINWGFREVTKKRHRVREDRLAWKLQALSRVKTLVALFRGNSYHLQKHSILMALQYNSNHTFLVWCNSLTGTH